MAGIDRIIETIAWDSAAKCDEILAAAKSQAEAIRAEAEAKAAQLNEAASAEARQRAELSIAAAGPRAAQTEKRILLQVKNEVIQQVITSALDRLRALPETQYFDLLTRLAAEHAQPGPGEMRLSQKDLDRLPADFAGRLGDITISPQPANISDGFILVYGDIEQNCTFDALVSARLDDMKDALHACVFA